MPISFAQKLIDHDETWFNDKPYVILADCRYDINATLNIAKRHPHIFACRCAIHCGWNFTGDR